MNERVKELAQQVGISYDYLNNTKQWVLIEALAELIVRECLNNMENCDGDLDFAIWKTKQDFGVKQ